MICVVQRLRDLRGVKNTEVVELAGDDVAPFPQQHFDRLLYGLGIVLLVDLRDDVAHFATAE